MDNVELNTFEEFEEKVTQLANKLNEKRSNSLKDFSPLLFRGQPKASSFLKTTLERYSPRQYSMKDYYYIMRSIKPDMESVTDKHWDLKDKYIKKNEKFFVEPQGYGFMTYLRHLGFPSPLLDWTESPYVAAFFAFCAAQNEDNKHEDNVAIYSFVEYYESLKSGWVNNATIVGCGSYITTHKRHISQQCNYTYCKKKIQKSYVYCSHEDAFLRNDNRQDILTKFIIPRTERAKVMEKLYLMNITAYSLFGNEESLLSTLAYREIEKSLL